MLTIEDVLMVKGPDVIVTSADSTVQEAVELMDHARVGAIIIREEREVTGIFTERDLLKRVVAKGLDPKTTKLQDVMTSPVKSCRLGDSVIASTRQLMDGHIRHLAIIEDGALVGMIGLRDLMSATIREEEARIKELENQTK